MNVNTLPSPMQIDQLKIGFSKSTQSVLTFEKKTRGCGISVISDLILVDKEGIPPSSQPAISPVQALIIPSPFSCHDPEPEFHHQDLPTDLFNEEELP